MLKNQKITLDDYVFGLSHKGYNDLTTPAGNSAAQKYGYNGKEFNDDLGLDWHDFSARNYDAALGRWMNIDPAIARWTGIDPVTHHSMSTYTAFDNNPIFWADPSGADSDESSYRPYDPARDKTLANRTGAHTANTANTGGNSNACTDCPTNANIDDTYNHSDFGKLTYGQQGWTDANGNNILNDVLLSTNTDVNLIFASTWTTGGPQFSQNGPYQLDFDKDFPQAKKRLFDPTTTPQHRIATRRLLKQALKEGGEVIPLSKYNYDLYYGHTVGTTFTFNQYLGMMLEVVNNGPIGRATRGVTPRGNGIAPSMRNASNSKPSKTQRNINKRRRNLKRKRADRDKKHNGKSS